MRIVGHGIDLTEVARIAELLERHGERFLTRCFTEAEVAYSRRRPKRQCEHLAVRFAAKEAALKALGTGRRHGIAWTDVAVERKSSGEPSIVLAGVAASIASERGITAWSVSLTHTAEVAAASVIAMAE